MTFSQRSIKIALFGVLFIANLLLAETEVAYKSENPVYLNS